MYLWHQAFLIQCIIMQQKGLVILYDDLNSDLYKSAHECIQEVVSMIFFKRVFLFVYHYLFVYINLLHIHTHINL